ncbi:MAG: 3-hydroxy-3-methylglutaryl-CoA reductase, partial [Thermoanaerobaculia bacterium]|nr:3-hydroxy-3-methylglutaryl-CoA reductase [Thermoanaerobaculia bacterium]
MTPTVLDSKAESLVRELVEGIRRFHQLPPDLDPATAAEIRRRALTEMTSGDLDDIGHHSFDVANASRRNCENLFGVAQIPMGIVGPVRLHGDHVDGEVYVPLATTEGALIASTNRGCAALRRAGGARVYVEDVGMTRAPVFRTSGLEETRRFVDWIEAHEQEV